MKQILLLKIGKNTIILIGMNKRIYFAVTDRFNDGDSTNDEPTNGGSTNEDKSNDGVDNEDSEVEASRDQLYQMKLVQLKKDLQIMKQQ